MSLQFIPDSGAQSQVSTADTQAQFASVPLPDPIRQSTAPAPLATTLNGKHPLQNRLAKWEETQMDFKMETLRRTFGAGEPIRRTMEFEIVKATDIMPSMLKPSSQSIHQEILLNKDATIDWEDIYTGNSDAHLYDFHSELERTMKI